MPTVNQRLQEELRRRRRDSQRREAEALKRVFGQEEEKPRQPSHRIVVHEYHCPDCKHRMWTEEDIAKSCECSICGFHGAFKKRED